MNQRRLEPNHAQDDWRSDSQRTQDEGWRGGRDELRSNARGYGVNSAFESEGPVRVSHRGKGPKGFKRSDDRIREDVGQALSDHHDIDASDVEVTVKDGEVTLTGTVDARHTKRLAERAIEHLSGVVDVHNQLRVAKAETTSTTEDKTTAAQPATNGRTAPVSRPH